MTAATAVDMRTPFVVLDADTNEYYPVTAKHFINDAGEIHHWGTAEPTREKAQALADHLNSLAKWGSMIAVPHRLDGSTKGYVCLCCGNWRAIYSGGHCGCENIGGPTQDEMFTEICELLESNGGSMYTDDISASLGGLGVKRARSFLQKLERRGRVARTAAHSPGAHTKWKLS